MKKVIILLIFLFLITGCDFEFTDNLEVKKEKDKYIYVLGETELESKVDIFKYIDEENNFDYKNMATDLGYDKILCAEDNALCKTYTNNNIPGYKLEIYLTGKNIKASTSGNSAVSDVGIRIKKGSEKTRTYFAKFNGTKSKYHINKGRDVIDIEQIVVLAYLMEKSAENPEINALDVFKKYKGEDGYILPF